MIDWRATRRRWILIGCALALATPIVRGPISTMLVTRGDMLALAGDARAAELYERARLVDGANTVAIDRILFQAILSHDPVRLERGIALATDALARTPDDLELRMDRALCLHLRRRFAPAIADFTAVGMRRRDARALLFAADDAAKLRRMHDARRLLEIAVHDEPAFVPVRVALARVGGER